MAIVDLPYRFNPRSYQERVFEEFYHGGKRRLGMVWHRRAGKDKTAFNLLVSEANRVPGYYPYVFPEKVAGRRILWDAIDGNGMRVLDHIPKELIYRKDEAEMTIVFRHPLRPKEPGSMFQVLGADRNLNILVGSNTKLVVYSEFSIMNPRAWELTRPILRENNGSAIFVYTPRGHNHAYDLYQTNVANDAWFTDYKTVESTRRDAPGESGAPVVSEADIAEDRKEGMTESDIQQEYFCSWEAPIPGAYYAEQFMRIDSDKRIQNVPWEPQYPVYTAWDLGFTDQMCIWFFQVIGREVRIIDFYVDNFKELEFYCGLVNDKPYRFAKHFGPHDIMVHSLSTGMTRWETAKNAGITFEPVEEYGVLEGINAVKNLLPRCVFDQQKTKYGISALRSYARRYNKTLNQWLKEPDHNWASHSADAFRYLAIAVWTVLTGGSVGPRRPAHGRHFDPYGEYGGQVAMPVGISDPLAGGDDIWEMRGY